ncbi:MAG: phosphohistidine phosphatase SixA [Gemmatimonadaceae bacterium]|nr:phosphohistidine phosphatase SixA [Gemmatimonadaceae bacterium]
MRILLVRHAIAEDRDTFVLTGKHDDARPLTPRGDRRMRRAVRGLQLLVPRIDIVATSPLVRAQQTASILVRSYGDVPSAEVLRPLVPGGSVDDIDRWLEAKRAQWREAAAIAVVALVGHEPELGQLATRWLAGVPGGWLPIKKGGIVAIDFADRVAEGKGRLVWALSPRVLMEMRDAASGA